MSDLKISFAYCLDVLGCGEIGVFFIVPHAVSESRVSLDNDLLGATGELSRLLCGLRDEDLLLVRFTLRLVLQLFDCLLFRFPLLFE